MGTYPVEIDSNGKSFNFIVRELTRSDDSEEIRKEMGYRKTFRWLSDIKEFKNMCGKHKRPKEIMPCIALVFYEDLAVSHFCSLIDLFCLSEFRHRDRVLSDLQRLFLIESDRDILLSQVSMEVALFDFADSKAPLRPESIRILDNLEREVYKVDHSPRFIADRRSCCKKHGFFSIGGV